jgi:hypothetical protein
MEYPGIEAGHTLRDAINYPPEICPFIYSVTDMDKITVEFFCHNINCDLTLKLPVKS